MQNFSKNSINYTVHLEFWVHLGTPFFLKYVPRLEKPPKGLAQSHQFFFFWYPLYFHSKVTFWKKDHFYEVHIS